MSQNMSDLRLQKYGFFHYRQEISDKIFQRNYNYLIISMNLFVIRFPREWSFIVVLYAAACKTRS
jgi:hypothetical protein